MDESYMRDWMRRQEEALIEEERRLERAGVVAYCSDGTRLVLAFGSGAVVDCKAHFYPNDGFLDWAVEPPRSRP
jgi:hypothetical protein